MSTKATREATTEDRDTARAEHRKQVYEQAQSMLDEASRLLRDGLGADEVTVRNTIWADGERQGYMRALRECSAVFDEQVRQVGAHVHAKTMEWAPVVAWRDWVAKQLAVRGEK